MFQAVFDLASALARFHAQAIAPLPHLWPTTAEEAQVKILEDTWRREAFASLSPVPRPEPEATLLFHLLHHLLLAPEPEGEARDRQTRAVADLVAHMEWASYAPPHDDAPSAAYRLLDEALATGTFDLAFPHLVPHLSPTDQRADRSLLKSWLDEAEAGNPATDITTCLQDHTPPEVVGAHLVQALFAQDSSRFHALAAGRAWPLNVAAVHTALGQAQGPGLAQQTAARVEQANLTVQLGALLDQGDETLSSEVWHTLFDACSQIPGVAPELTWALQSEEGKSNWQAWITGSRPAPRGLGEMASRAVTAAIVQARQQPQGLADVLTQLGEQKTLHLHQVQFLRELIWRQASRLPPEYTWTGAIYTWTEGDHGLQQRLVQIDGLLSNVSLDRVPGAAYQVLDHALQWPDEFMALRERFALGLSPADQSWNKNLLRTALCNGVWDSVPQGHLISNLVPAPWVGLALVEQVAQRERISPLFGDPLAWPLPVLDLLQRYRETPNAYLMTGLPFSETALYQGLNEALTHDRYPEALRDRLLEACRPLRPHVAEDRYRTEDRAMALQARPASSPRPRCRV